MKKILLSITFVLMTMLSFACHSSYTTLVSGPTDIGGGQYSTTVQFCIGQTDNWGGTNNFTVTLNGANFVSYAPTSISNTYNAFTWASCKIAGFNQTCQSSSCISVTANATSTSTTNVITYSTSSSTPAGWPLVPNAGERCGVNAVSYCFNFTFVSDAYPTSIVLAGNVETQRGYVGCPCPFAAITQNAPCNGAYGASMTLTFAVLPIELKEFYGHNKDGVNKLYWTTLTEINNEYFTIERSRDAINWDNIGIVPGNGNSSTSIMYEFDDDSYDNGTNYYRLTQTDFDGKFETFEIISITTPNVKFLDYKIVNLLGQEVIDDTNQHRIIMWSDNTSKFIPAGYRTPKRTN
jgi:hypothetical protein